MSIKQVLKFMYQSGHDQSLQQEIKNLLKTGDGNISDSAELDEQEISSLIIDGGIRITKFAQEKGWQFFPEELVNVIRAFEKHKLGIITEKELFNYLGISNSPDTSVEQPKIVEFVYRGTVYRRVIKPNKLTSQINPKKEVVQFMHKTSEDTVLQQELKQILGVGDGNISNTQELDPIESAVLIGNRAPKVVNLARKHRFYFTEADLTEVIKMFERNRSGEISESELLKNLGISEDALAVLATQKAIKLMFRGDLYEKIMNPSFDTSTSPNPKLAVVRFIAQSADNEDLQRELEDILGVGDGNISNPAEIDKQESEALKGARGAQVTELARSKGYIFSREDLTEVVSGFESYRLGKISQAGLSASIGLSTNEFPPASTQRIQEFIYRGQRYTKIDGILIPIPTETTNPKTEVVRFMEQTSTDKKLQEELKELLGVGDGNISSVKELDQEEVGALLGGKSPIVSSLGQKYGFSFSPQDLETVISTFQSHQSGAISEEDLFKSLEIKRQKKGFFDQVVQLLNKKVF